MSCATKNITRLIKDSYRSPVVKYNVDISADIFTLTIYDEFGGIEKVSKTGLFADQNTVYFEAFDLPVQDYKYEIIRTHNGKDKLILSGKYIVTKKPDSCSCESSDTINFIDNQGDEVFNFEYSEVILNVGGSPGGSVSWTEITGKPTTFPPSSHTHTWSEITEKPPFFSGHYSDLSGKPVLFSGSYTDLTDKPYLFSGDYNDLTNKPTIPAAPVNSDWSSVSGLSQILNKPTLFSGVYSDLTGKPSIPAAQVNSDWNAVSGVSQILNKPSLFDGSWNSLTGKPSTFSPPIASPTVLGGVKIWTGTQTAYDAIATKASDVLYFIEKT